MGRNAAATLVQAQRPFGRLEPRRHFTLSLDQLHPVIRIAHRAGHGLQVPDRILFDHELVLIVRGRGTARFADETLELAANDLVFIPPFVPHAFGGGEEVEHIAIHFDLAPHVPGAADTPPDREPYEVRFPRGLGLPRRTRLREQDGRGRHLARIVELRRRGDERSEAEAVSRLMQVIVELLREPASEAAGPTRELDVRNRIRLERAVAWLDGNLHREIGVEDLADAAGISPSHLRRLFSDWTGYSPQEYLRRARIDRAKVLLADVDLTLKQIAGRCGFKDPFHFSKVFRQIDGLPPSRYREALLAGRVDERK